MYFMCSIFSNDTVVPEDGVPTSLPSDFDSLSSSVSLCVSRSSTDRSTTASVRRSVNGIGATSFNARFSSLSWAIWWVFCYRYVYGWLVHSALWFPLRQNPSPFSVSSPSFLRSIALRLLCNTDATGECSSRQTSSPSAASSSSSSSSSSSLSSSSSSSSALNIGHSLWCFEGCF